MSNEGKYELKIIPEVLVASIRKPIKKRDELKPRFEILKEILGNKITGPAFLIVHYDTPVEDGLDAEIGYPVSERVEGEDIECRILPRELAFIKVYKGPYEGIRDVSLELGKYRYSRGLPSGLSPREVYLSGPFNENPNENITEVQSTIHNWEERFVDRLGEILGEDPKTEILQGSDNVTYFSTAKERGTWLKGALEKLENLATETEKYEVVSKCAHIRPQADIDKYKAIYEKNHDFDEFIDAYAEALNWPMKPYREGNILYLSKVYMNPEGVKNAKNEAERIRAACFCPIVHEMLGELPANFCYCGAGWARQMIEGIIGEEVKFELLQTVIKGNEYCKWAVHLPEHVIKK